MDDGTKLEVEKVDNNMVKETETFKDGTQLQMVVIENVVRFLIILPDYMTPCRVRSGS